MNVLVTNTYATQSYAIICALRPYADRIVASMEGDNRISARLSQAAASRFVDKRVYVPSPVVDWQSGKIQRENTEREESFVASLLEICQEEKIDVIFPSWDPYIYVLSKNKPAFEKVGTLIPVPDYETVIGALDKYRTIQAAEELGLPCPRTYLYDNPGQLSFIAEKEGFPLVIKPRVSSGGRGLAVIKDLPELLHRIPPIVEQYGKPMIQEYIPGRNKISFPVVLDRSGEIKFAANQKIVRNFRVTARFATVEQSTAFDPQIIDGAEKLLKKLGWWGAVSVSGIRDPRDGLFKLMEINPRFPRNMWRALAVGVNEPLMCVRITNGEFVEPVKDFPTGVLFVSPIDDIFLLGLQILDTLMYRFRASVLRCRPLDQHSRPMGLTAQIHSFLQTYVGDHKKAFDPHFKNFFHDPLPSFLWWFRFSIWIVASFKHLGK